MAGDPRGVFGRVRKAVRFSVAFAAAAAVCPTFRRQVLNVAFLGIVAVLIPGAFAAFLFQGVLKEYEAQQVSRLEGTATALAAAVDRQLSRHIAALTVLALMPNPRASGDLAEFDSIARGAAYSLGGKIVLLEGPPHYRMLLNTQVPFGSPLPTGVFAGCGIGMTTTYDTAAATQQPAVSDLFRDAVQGGPMFAIVVPVMQGPAPRLLAFGLGPQSLQHLLMEPSLGPGTFAAVADGNLRVVAHTVEKDGRSVEQPAPEWVTKAIEGKQRVVVAGPGWQGHDSIYVIKRLATAPGWTVTVAEARQNALMDGGREVVWIAAGVAAVGFGVMLILWIAQRERVIDAREEAAALRAGRADVERLLEGLPAMIFLREMSRSGGAPRTLFRGGDIETVLGWPASLLDNTAEWARLLHPDDPRPDEYLAKLRSEESVEFETRVRQPAGGWRHLKTEARVLMREPNGTIEVVGYCIDITGQRTAEHRARTADRMAMLGELATHLSHELRQPLATINLTVQNVIAAMEEGPTHDVRPRLERIIRDVTRASTLIDRLRRLSRKQDLKPTLETFSLETVVDDALLMTEYALDEAGVTVELALGEPVPIVLGHALLLGQVLSNLFLNARDAMTLNPPGRPCLIRVSVIAQSETSVRLTVADTGPGIAPGLLDRLFEPFVTTKPPAVGTGLGLSISKAHVVQMGGDLEAHSSSGGAVFTITLLRAGDSERSVSEDFAPSSGDAMG